MKRKEFVKELNKHGCKLLRHGANHDIYLNPQTGKKQPVPRHNEIEDDLAKHIRKYLGLEWQTNPAVRCSTWLQENMDIEYSQEEHLTIGTPSQIPIWEEMFY